MQTSLKELFSTHTQHTGQWTNKHPKKNIIISFPIISSKEHITHLCNSCNNLANWKNADGVIAVLLLQLNATGSNANTTWRIICNITGGCAIIPNDNLNVMFFSHVLCKSSNYNNTGNKSIITNFYTFSRNLISGVCVCLHTTEKYTKYTKHWQYVWFKDGIGCVYWKLVLAGKSACAYWKV